jgi:hypothetical protein
MNAVFLRISVALLALSACAAQAEDNRMAHSRDIEACKNARHATRVAFAECINRVNKKWWIANGDRHFDVLEYAQARELVAAQQRDSGRITELEYLAERAKIKTDLKSELVKRDAAATPPVVNVNPQYRAPVNCYPAGRSVTCF